MYRYIQCQQKKNKTREFLTGKSPVPMEDPWLQLKAEATPRGTDFSVSTGRVKKLHTLLVSLYF